MLRLLQFNLGLIINFIYRFIYTCLICYLLFLNQMYWCIHFRIHLFILINLLYFLHIYLLIYFIYLFSLLIYLGSFTFSPAFLYFTYIYLII
jgi:hypothetical protein